MSEGFVTVQADNLSRLDTLLRDTAIMPPAGVFLRAASGPRDIEHLSSRLAVIEAKLGRPDGSTRIIIASADTPAFIRSLAGSWVRHPRLSGFLFDPVPLGGWDPLNRPSWLETARALTLLLAADLDVPAFDMVERDPTDLENTVRLAFKDGFSGLVTDDLDTCFGITHLLNTQSPPGGRLIAKTRSAGT